MEKILIIHHWSSVGGSGISLYNTMRSLKKDYEVVAYIPESPKDLYEFLVDKGLVTKTYSFVCGQIPYYSGGSSPKKLGFWYLLVNALMQFSYWKRVIEEERPDIIMVNSKVLCWMVPLFKGIKSVCFVRETIKGRPDNFINSIMKLMLERFTLVSYLSNYDESQMGLVKARTVVSPDILDPDEYIDDLGKKKACEMLNIDFSKFNVAFVGGVDKLKGIDVLLESLVYLKDKDISIVIAGNPQFKALNSVEPPGFIKRILNRKVKDNVNYVLDFLKSHQLDEYMSFVGVQKDISVVYSACDLLVFPMLAPHQARPAFEIGVQRKPVVITGFDNIKEFIIDGENGLYFEPNNPMDLAKKIIFFKENDLVRDCMGLKNFDLTMSYHTEDYSIGKLLEALRSI